MAEIEDAQDTLLTLTADIVAAHVSNNSVAVNDLPNLIQNVHSALSGIVGTSGAPEPKPEPKVSIRSSVKPDFIVCLEDGKKLKMLKRHLMTHYQMTPDQYRQKWGLNADYPMVRPITPSSAGRWPRRSAWAPSAAAPRARNKPLGGRAGGDRPP